FSNRCHLHFENKQPPFRIKAAKCGGHTSKFDPTIPSEKFRTRLINCSRGGNEADGLIRCALSWPTCWYLRFGAFLKFGLLILALLWSLELGVWSFSPDYPSTTAPSLHAISSSHSQSPPPETTPVHLSLHSTADAAGPAQYPTTAAA